MTGKQKNTITLVIARIAYLTRNRKGTHYA